MSPADWRDAPGPRVFTIPPAARFVDVLAQGVATCAAASDDPFALADVVVLAPNRRTSRALRRAFAERLDGAARITPTVQPIGDVVEDEPPFEPGAIALDLPPAIEPAHRVFELAALTRRLLGRRGQADDPGAALALAQALAPLIDDLAMEPGADADALAAQFQDAPQHFQDAAVFLGIVREFWPKRLAELGLIDPGARRARLISALIERWEAEPPRRAILAAGSTGTQAPTRALMAATARLPAGAVVLPGLDVDLDDAAWTRLDDGHPQAAMRRFLEAAGVARANVRVWPGGEETAEARVRRRVVNDALRPATATADWLDRVRALGRPSEVAAALDGVTLYEAASADSEGRSIALALRRALETPERTAMLVTPDPSLVRRVETHLRRWGVEADASIGEPLIATETGAFLAAVLGPVRRPDAALDLAVLAKHPMTACGQDAVVWRDAVAELEPLALRGVRRGDGLAGWRRRLHAAGGAKAARASAAVDALEAALGALFAASGAQDSTLADFARAHAAAAEALAAGPDHTGAERIWRGPAGEAAARLCAELIQYAGVLGPTDIDGYARVFERLAQSRAVRRPEGGHPRLRILSPIEARLQSADLVILGGLNEHVWPAAPAPDPFVSRTMRRAANLPDPEGRLGASAHDFAQLLGAPRVVLTRAKRQDEAPTVASRWLWRLKTLAEGAGSPLKPEATAGYEAIARALDRVEAHDVARGAPPAARPPVAARPRSASVSDVRTWVRDPYGFYARRVLKLKPREAFDREPDQRERGSAIHRALEALAGRETDAGFVDAFVAQAEADLIEAGYRAADLAVERPRMKRIAVWIAGWAADRRGDGWRLDAAETTGRIALPGPAGDFDLHARADRLERLGDLWSIIDYKTGAPPSAKDVDAGLEPQMPLQGLILRRGGFPGATASDPLSLLILKLSGGRKPGEASEFKDIAAKIDVAEAGLVERIAAFDDEATAYDARRRKVFRAGQTGDYDRLARRKEWAGPDEADGGGE